MSKFYADRFYKDEHGNYYTGEYLKNNYCWEHITDASKHGYKDVSLYSMSWDEFNKEMTGKPVRCNYSQIFAPDAQMILCNNIPEVCPYIWDYLENGSAYDEETDEYSEIFQWYIIDPNTAERLKDHTEQLVFYWPDADLYILGVTHWGTGWNYVGTEFTY